MLGTTAYQPGVDRPLACRRQLREHAVRHGDGHEHATHEQSGVPQHRASFWDVWSRSAQTIIRGSKSQDNVMSALLGADRINACVMSDGAVFTDVGVS